MLNLTALQGRFVSDPELRQTQIGTVVCSFRLAVDRSYTPKGDERKADFIDVVAWRQTAEFVCKYFAKGDLILVQGCIQTRNYEDKNGAKRTAFEVVASEVNFCGGKKNAQGDAVPATAKAHARNNKADAQAGGNAADGFIEIDGEDDLPF